MSTKIEWTDVTDNIITARDGGWWCRKISEGCKNCYAARLNQNSFFGGNMRAYSGVPPVLMLREDIIDGWARQKKAKKHFVASMTDVFGEWVQFEWALRFLRGMAAAPLQTFQVLTKRADVMRHYIERWLSLDGLVEVPENIWLGVSVENDPAGDERIHDLLKIRCKVRFLSVEPMLGPVDVEWAFPQTDAVSLASIITEPSEGIKWVICGGESGPKARPVHPDWVRGLRDQCVAAEVPFFFKQWGEFMPAEDCDITHPVMSKPYAHWLNGVGFVRPGKKATGRMLDGRVWNEFPDDAPVMKVVA